MFVGGRGDHRRMRGVTGGEGGAGGGVAAKGAKGEKDGVLGRRKNWGKNYPRVGLSAKHNRWKFHRVCFVIFYFILPKLTRRNLNLSSAG